MNDNEEMRAVFAELAALGPMPGGCDRCDADQVARINPLVPWLLHMTIRHAPDCPELRAA